MRNQIKRQLKGVGLVIIIMGAAFAGLGLHSKNRQANLDVHGVSEPAEITRAALESGSKGKKRCIITVQWGAPQARETRKFEVTKEYFQTLVDAEGKLVAPGTTIRHIPGEPGSALMEGAVYPMGGFLGVGYGFLIFGLFLIFLGFQVLAGPAASRRPFTGGFED